MSSDGSWRSGGSTGARVRSRRPWPSVATVGRRLALAWAATLGCATHPAIAPPGAVPARSATVDLPPAPERSRDALVFGSLDVEWAPPSFIAGDTTELTRWLRDQSDILLVTPAELASARWDARLRRLVRELHPGANVVGHGEARLSAVAGGALTRNLVRQPFVGRTDLRPRYAASELRLDAGWLTRERHALLERAKSVLVVGRAELDLASWRSLQAFAAGSCAAPLAVLAEGQERSLAVLEPFLDHADLVLWRLYRARLDARLPGLRVDLEPFRRELPRAAFPDANAYERHVCGHASWKAVSPLFTCGASPESCPSAPRLFLVSGARIGTLEPSVYVPEGCGDRLGRDFVAEARELAREAAEVAGAYLDISWSAMADRLGAVTEVHAALEDLCMPRRRRLASRDLDEARVRLARVGRSLAASEAARDGASFMLSDDAFFVPGLGSVRQLARFEAGEDTAARRAVREAKSLREFVNGRSQCRDRHGEVPLFVALADANSGAVSFAGYFFEEELVCADLPPLLASHGAAGPAERVPEGAGSPDPHTETDGQVMASPPAETPPVVGSGR